MRELARHLAVNPGTVSRWLRRGMPRDLEGAQRWREEHAGVRVKPRAAAADEPTGDESFTRWRTRREKAQALQAELDLRERCGELMNVEKAIAWAARRCTAAREIVLGMAARCAPVVAAESDARVVGDILTAEAHRVLTELSGMGGDFAEYRDARRQGKDKP